MKAVLRWTQWLLFAGAVSLLGYFAFGVAESWTFQEAEQRQLDRLLVDSRMAGSPLPVSGNGLIGRLEIPSLALSVIVLEGSSPSVLRHAAGHISGTPLPGQPGNVGVSAHRDTFFRPLRNIRRDDIISFTTLQGEFRYRVISTRIVGPSDVDVLDASETESLTLVTCYPFYFVGSAPDRFIVRAARIT